MKKHKNVMQPLPWEHKTDRNRMSAVVDFEKLNEVLNRRAEAHRYDNWSIEDTICKDCSDKDTCKYAGDPFCTDTCLADK